MADEIQHLLTLTVALLLAMVNARGNKRKTGIADAKTLSKQRR
jgi:hypothetical protein